MSVSFAEDNKRAIGILLKAIALFKLSMNEHSQMRITMHAQELLFVSASRQLLVASCSSLCHNPTSHKNFFAVRS